MPATPAGVRGAPSPAGAPRCRRRSTRTRTSRRCSPTNDEWTRRTDGIRERPQGRHDDGSLSVDAGPEALEMSGVALNEIETLVLATTTPDRVVPGSSPAWRASSGCAAARWTSRRLLGLHVRARRRSRPDRDGREQGPLHRHGHAHADHRLDGPQHGDPVRRRVGRRRARGLHPATGSCSGGTSMRTAPPRSSSTRRSAA
jgi:hypothetical protein